MTGGPQRRPTVAIIGAGIAGLAAANALRGVAAVILLDSAAVVGGKLRQARVAGVDVDEGAESMIARRPEGLDLVRQAGLGDQLVHPLVGATGIFSRGRMHPIPAGQLLGVPGDVDAVRRSGLLATRELARLRLDAVLPPRRQAEEGTEADPTVAAVVGGRLGRAVVDRLVEPLLGGVYAGRADALSFDATMPQVAAASRRRRSLLAAVREVTSASSSAGAAFASVRGGLGRLAVVLADRSGATVRTATTARELHRRQSGWRVVVGPASHPEAIDVDAVILAIPATPAGRLLADVAPAAAADLGAIDYASVAILTLAYPVLATRGWPTGSGFLVPPVEGRLVKGVTFSTQKWGPLADEAPELSFVRLSVGRHGEQHVLQRDDDELAEAVSRDLSEIVGVDGRPVDTRVSRWGGALPQYAPGHRARVARISAVIDRLPGLAVCGAAYEGVGVPACVASGRAAAARIASHLAAGREWVHE